MEAADIVDGFISSKEFQGRNLNTEEYLNIMYEGMLGRKPDSTGLKNWTETLENGVSPEYIQKGKADDEYVRDLYRALFDRGADETGYSVWMEQLQAGVPRVNVLKGFVDSEEFANLCNRFGIIKGTVEVEKGGQVFYYSDQFVRRMYRIALNREADAEGLEYWKKISE